MSFMKKFQAIEIPYEILSLHVDCKKAYPYVRDDNGDKLLFCVSPIHGRSFVIGQKENGRWIVSKGNGLSYTTQSFVDVSEYDNYVWGALTKQSALRDYNIGNEINALGIKTNKMEAVLELSIQLKDKDDFLRPCLLQYEVECPYRLCDFPFMSRNEHKKVVASWFNIGSKYSEAYLIAADILVRNLHLLHKSKIMHNALHVQNYTWALELLDFESARTEKLPYSNSDYEKNVLLLMDGEIMKTYEIINYIGWCIGEKVDYDRIDKLFNHYGFDLEQYKLTSDMKR